MTRTNMKQERAQTICERLLKAFWLTGWRVALVHFPELPDETKVDAHGVEWRRPRRRLGLCRYQQQTIEFSITHVENDADKFVIETIVEEVAHILSPGDTNHGERWKNARDRVWNTLLELDDNIPRSPLWYVRHGRTVADSFDAGTPD